MVHAEAITQPVRDQLVREIAKWRGQPIETALDMARELLDGFAPDYIQAIADAEMASTVAGMDAVWGKVPRSVLDMFEPVIVDSPPVIPDLESGGDSLKKLIFPRHENAVQDLISRDIFRRPDFDRLADEAKRRAFTMAGDHTEATIEKIRDVLVEDMEEGPSLRGFRDKLANAVDTSPYSPSHLETVFRVNVSSAFSRGSRKIEQQPIMQDLFPYKKYIAVRDSRVRPEHSALMYLGYDGTNIYRADDREFWDRFDYPWSWNCRCSSRVITKDAAARYGVKEAQEWLRTGVKPPLRTRLHYIPFDRDPTFVGPGVSVMGLRRHHIDCIGETPLPACEFNKRLRDIVSRGLSV